MTVFRIHVFCLSVLIIGAVPICTKEIDLKTSVTKNLKINERNELKNNVTKNTKEDVLFAKFFKNINAVDDVNSVKGKVKKSDNVTLKIGVSHVAYYANIKDFKTLKTNAPLKEADMSGADIELSKIYAKYINKDIEWFFINKDPDNPYIMTEFITLLENGTLDIAVGGMFRVYGDSVSYSGIYNRLTAFWVYSVKRDERNWMSLMKKIHGLYIFFGFSIIYTIVWYFIRKFDCDKSFLGDIIIKSWGAMLGGASVDEGTSKKQRILFTVYMYMCIHFSAYIGVEMYSFLTIQDPPELLRTNEAIMTSGRKPYLRPIAKHFLEDKRYTAFARDSANCIDIPECLVKVIDEDGVTVTTDGLYIAFQTNTSINNEAKLLRADDNILTVYHEMIVRKDSEYVESFQKVVARLFEGGICNWLFQQSLGINAFEKAEVISKNTVAFSYGCQEGCAITLAHQADGAFFVWFAGCAISLIVFVVELLINKQQK